MDGLAFDEESSGNQEERKRRLERSIVKSDDEKLAEFLKTSRERRNPARVVPAIWPVEGRISSIFGPRKSPFGRSVRFHAGMDIAAPSGTSVIAPAPGKIIFAGRDGGYGLSVEIAHWGGIVTRHSHLSKILVKPGDLVQRRHAIGLVGSTGMSTGPHLHYEVMVEGIQVNPLRYILE